MNKDSIEIPKKAVKEGLLSEFYEICPGALEVSLVLKAYSSEETKMARVGVRTICKHTGFSLSKVIRVLGKLEAANIVDVPLKGHPGKAYIYKLRAL